MVVMESDEIGEVESPLQVVVVDQQQKNQPFSSLGRQSSIFSLTLDEFQHTLCGGGKDFGSMNMDEFLTSIWNAEENQAINSNNTNHNHSQNNNCSNKQLGNLNVNLSLNETASSKSIANKQPGLPRQGSLTLPAPLCRKTVEEVWSEIHKGKQAGDQEQSNNNTNNVQNAENTGKTRQPTFGEMTLEDFLVKAGVVREQCMPPTATPSQHQPQYGLYQTNNKPAVGPGFVPSRPMMGMSGSGGGGFGVSPYQTMPPGGVIGDSSGFVNDNKRGGGYQPAAPPPTAVCYNGNVAPGGGYGPGQAMGVVSPMSPVSPEGMCGNQIDNVATQFGMDIGARGRKRIIDGSIERVVERRQRRMIKNRESAARSRARKQAYTVELEAELNQLKQENAQLKQALAELERKKKQQYSEEWRMKTQSKAEKAKEKLRTIRRNLSCPL